MSISTAMLSMSYASKGWLLRERPSTRMVCSIRNGGSLAMIMRGLKIGAVGAKNNLLLSKIVLLLSNK